MADLSDRGKALENEWFRKHEEELIRKARERREDRLAKERDAEREKQKKLHFMKCPKCGDELVEVEHEGIKVDRCTSCQGVFFDAGELDDLLLKKQDERRSFFRKLSGLFGG
jgi:ribosomal protein L37AE/L43A